MDPLTAIAAASLASVLAPFGLMAAWCGSGNDRLLRAAGGSLGVAALLLALLFVL